MQLTRVIGQYAQSYHLPAAQGWVTSAVAAWREHKKDVLFLPHPRPRNNLWLRKNPWLPTELLPHLRRQVATALRDRR